MDLKLQSIFILIFLKKRFYDQTAFYNFSFHNFSL